MDIVITIPRHEYKNIDKEIEWAKNLTQNQRESSTKNWTLSKLPSKIKNGDRCYFIKNGKIEHYRNILGWDKYSGGFSCDVTGRSWYGSYLELSVLPVYLKNPVPMKGFQGFRYIERIEA